MQLVEVRGCEGAAVRRCQAGFTLIEVMVVMALIATLAGIGLMSYGNAVTRAKEAALLENLFRMREAINEYYADKNKYPSSLETLAAEKYIRRVPVDPFTNSAETWEEVMSDLDPSNPSAEPGVYDVKSGSEATAINGTRYADW